MACKPKTRIAVACGVGWFLLILGACLIPILEWVVKKKVESTVIIRTDSPVYAFWQDPPVPIYLQLYMFNVTNPIEFIQEGKRPFLQEVGPYTYSERRVKYDIKFNPNGTVTYRQNRTFQFIPEKSGKGLSEDDIYCTANPVYWSLYNALKYEYPLVRETIYIATQLFDEHPLMYRPFKELIWGYHDPLLNVTKAIDPKWFYTDFIGFFMNKNNTNDGVYTVFTGETDIMKLGTIDKYNGSSYLNFWSTVWANMINGTDGTLGPPYLPKDTVTHVFSSDICRSVPGMYSGDVSSSQGIKLWRFIGPHSSLQNATENPDNAGFCTPKDNCLGAGLNNITNCQGVDFFNLPSATSMPHFLHADPRYLHAVVGLSPNEKLHETTLDIEPYTGLVLQANKRLQVNVHLEPIANVPETLNITTVFLPIMWLDENAAIDDASAKKLEDLLFTPLKLILGLEIGLMVLGVVVLTASIIYCVKKKLENSEERRPLVQPNEYVDYDAPPQATGGNTVTYGGTNPILTGGGDGDNTVDRSAGTVRKV